MIRPLALLCFYIGMCSNINSHAAIVVTEFEGVADAGTTFRSIVTGPTAPYSDPSGFSFQGAGSAAIFDTSATLAFNGNISDFVGFGDNSSVTVTYAGGAFDLISLVGGPSSDAGSSPVLFTVNTTLFGGGAGPGATFSLTVATPLSLNYTGLGSVTISAADDSAFDSATFNVVPEPSSAALICLGSFFILRRRTRS